MKQHPPSERGDNLGPEMPDDDEFMAILHEAIADCNGFVYLGMDLEAQIRFIRWMRNNPEKAQKLLDPDLKPYVNTVSRLRALELEYQV